MRLSSSQRTLLIYAALFVLTSVFFGMLSISFGRDINFDLANYHFYNAHAFLTSRIDYDLYVALFQTFFPPAPDLIFYWLTTNFSPKTVGFLMGVIHGLNFWLLFLVSKEVLRNILSRSYLYFWSFVLAAIGFAGAFSLGEHGMTYNDNLVGLFVLASLLMIIIYWNKSRTDLAKGPRDLLFVAGILMGMAFGIKLTAATFAIGLTVPIIFLSWDYKNNLKNISVWAGGIFMGILMGYGYWMYYLWHRFANPIFPFFNNIFKSPYYAFDNYSRRDDLVPDTVWETIMLPFKYATDNDITSAWTFSEARWAILFSLLCILVLIFVFQILTRKKIIKNLGSAPVWIILLFIVISYIIWLYVFADYRFLNPLESLIPLAIFLILLLILGRQRILLVTLVNILIIALIVGALRVPRMGRQPWNTEDYFVDQAISIEDSDNTMVLLVSNRGIGHLVPYFPPKVRFVRIDGNYFISDASQSEIDDVINKHKGRFVGLILETELEKDTSTFLKHGYSTETKNCNHITSNLVVGADYLLCPLSKTN